MNFYMPVVNRKKKIYKQIAYYTTYGSILFGNLSNQFNIECKDIFNKPFNPLLISWPGCAESLSRTRKARENAYFIIV